VVIYVTFRQETGIDELRAGEANGSITSGETPTGHRLYPVWYMSFRHETGIDELRAGEATGSITSGETPTGHRLYPVWYMSHSVTNVLP
jgi:hypothetical protein